MTIKVKTNLWTQTEQRRNARFHRVQEEVGWQIGDISVDELEILPIREYFGVESMRQHVRIRD